MMKSTLLLALVGCATALGPSDSCGACDLYKGLAQPSDDVLCMRTKKGQLRCKPPKSNGKCKGKYDKVYCSTPAPEPPAKVPLTCAKAGPQAPRDLSTTSGDLHYGAKTPTAALLNAQQAMDMFQTNIHFHLGAEHKSDEYNDGHASEEYDHDHTGRRLLSESARPGWMCPNVNSVDDSHVWKYCKGEMHVGNSYEVHYVHSSAGSASEFFEDGLGSAAGGGLIANPMIVVEAVVYHIIAGEQIGDDDLAHGWEHYNHEDALAYSGSTTGTGNNNDKVCSPYVVTWHVDPHCRQVTAASFDNMCKQMKELYGMEDDLYPHGSRILVDESLVVGAEHVHHLDHL